MSFSCAVCRTLQLLNLQNTVSASLGLYASYRSGRAAILASAEIMLTAHQEMNPLLDRVASHRADLSYPMRAAARRRNHLGQILVLFDACLQT